MTTPARRAQPLLLVIALTPLWVALWAGVAAPGFGGGMGSRGVNIAGIPVGFVILGLAGILTLAGLAVVRWSRWPWVGIALFAIPATLVVVFGPALILILANLGGS